MSVIVCLKQIHQHALESSTVFLQSDTVVTIFFRCHFRAATILGQLLFEGGYYLRAAFILLGSNDN